MCDEAGGFKFCTCAEDTGRRRTRNKHQYKYVWTLLKLKATENERNIKGKILKPVSDLGEGITAEETIKKLNSTDCFDFDYTPAEEDTLHISTFCEEQRTKYFSLIFRNGHWNYGNNAFSPKETIKEGYIEITGE